MLPTDIENVRSSIQSGIQSVSSEMTGTSARLFGLYLGGALQTTEAGHHYCNLEWFEPLLMHQFRNESRDSDKIWDCEIDIVYPRSQEAISQALAPKFDRDGQYIEDGPIYSDAVFHYTRVTLDRTDLDW